MKDNDTVKIEVTSKEAKLIMACLAMSATMCNMGSHLTHRGMEQYRECMNLKDKISDKLQ